MPVNNFNYSVSWSDFSQRSARPSGETEDAQIHPELSFSNFQLGRNRNAVIVRDVDIDIELVSSDCWVVSSQQSDFLLKHEQGHFDILAICARDIYKAILNLSGRTTRDLQSKLEAVKTRLGRKATLIDGRYDVKTRHSLDANMQASWDSSIDTVKKNAVGKLDDLPV